MKSESNICTDRIAPNLTILAGVITRNGLKTPKYRDFAKFSNAYPVIKNTFSFSKFLFYWTIILFWRSSLRTSMFGLSCHFYSQNLPENAIKQAFLAISGSGGSKWLDLSGYWLDLGGIHPGWSVGAIWTHWNCPRGPPRGVRNGQKMP